jgi:four helix bundle protein
VTGDEWQAEEGGINMGKPHPNISQGSTAELETQTLLSRNLDFLKSNQAEPLLQELEEISRMIIGLQKSLRSSK